MSPVLQVFKVPDTLNPILENMSTGKELLNCSLVNKRFASCTRPLLDHHALSTSASPWLRRLADAVSAEKFAGIQNKTYILARLLEGFEGSEAEGALDIESRVALLRGGKGQSLKNLLEPLKSNIFPNCLSASEINDIVTINEALSDTSRTPSIDKMCEELKEAGFRREIEQLECAGPLTLTKVERLYSKGGILALLNGISSEALQAFAEISDDDISTGIVEFLRRRHATCKTPADVTEAQHAEEVIDKMVKNNRLFVNYPRDSLGGVPLDDAIYWRSPMVVQDLINYGADINWTDDFGQTAAHHAVIKKRVDVLQILLKSGGPDAINRPDNGGSTPLRSASRAGASQVVKFLLENGATPLDQSNVTAIV